MQQWHCTRVASQEPTKLGTHTAYSKSSIKQGLPVINQLDVEHILVICNSQRTRVASQEPTRLATHPGYGQVELNKGCPSRTTWTWHTFWIFKNCHFIRVSPSRTDWIWHTFWICNNGTAQGSPVKDQLGLAHTLHIQKVALNKGCLL